jgi:hypothetical protein
MGGRWITERPEIVTLNIRLTAEERDRLKAKLFRKGISSMSSWFRQRAIEEITKPETVTTVVGVSDDTGVAAN